MKMSEATQVITPHIAWASVEARKRLLNLIVKNIKDFIKG